MTITELKNELSIESAAELHPDALYVFKFAGRISPENMEVIHKHLSRIGVKAILVDSQVEAIYKIDRGA
jgi:hypothetical protein